jgi:hypothetical protein
MPEAERYPTPAKLRRQLDKLDELVAEAERIRNDVSEQLRRLHNSRPRQSGQLFRP